MDPATLYLVFTVRSVCLTRREFAPDWLKTGVIHIDTLDQKYWP